MTGAAAVGDWRELAECASGYNPELWFTDEKPGVKPRVEVPRETEAVKVCRRRCPVRDACLREGMASDARSPGGKGFGIWGGQTPYQRRRLAARKGLVSSIGSERRVRALARNGWTSTQINVAMGEDVEAVSDWRLSNIRQGHSPLLTRDLADAIARAYVALSAHHSTGQFAHLVRGRANAAGWPGPDAWDGLDIDDPNVFPRTLAA